LKNVETTLLRKMLVEKCWINIFVEKCYIETFSNARDGRKIERRQFRWALVGWKFASLSVGR
jgi:hypothetical protein